MKNSIKIVLFVIVITLGVYLIDTTLTASTLDCHCVNEYEAIGECIDICWDTYEVECLMVVLLGHGCWYSDCVTHWKFYCENDARGYLTTVWDNCWDCYI